MVSVISTGFVLGMIASVLTLSSFSMKSMLPLRMFALASNIFFIAYAYLGSLLPVLILHSLLLPLNVKRLMEILKLTSEIKKANETSPVSQWLLPHMTRYFCKAGEMLFREGDDADFMVYVAAGEVRLEGLPTTIGAGELIGEIGLFAPDKKRTRTLICHTDCELYKMSAEMLHRLYFQHPNIGFYFMRLIVGRLQRDIDREKSFRGRTA